MCLPLMTPQAALFPDVEDFGARLDATRTAADRQALGIEVLDQLAAIGFFGGAPTPRLRYAQGSAPTTFGTRTVGQYTWHDNTITLYETAFTRGPRAFLAAIIHESTHASQPAPSSKQMLAELEVDAALAEIRWAGLYGGYTVNSFGRAWSYADEQYRRHMTLADESVTREELRGVHEEWTTSLRAIPTPHRDLPCTQAEPVAVACDGPDQQQRIEAANERLMEMLTAGSVTPEPEIVSCLGYYRVGATIDIEYGRAGCERAEKTGLKIWCETHCTTHDREAWVFATFDDGQITYERVDALPFEAECEPPVPPCTWTMVAVGEQHTPMFECATTGKRIAPHGLWANRTGD